MPPSSKYRSSFAHRRERQRQSHHQRQRIEDWTTEQIGERRRYGLPPLLTLGQLQAEVDAEIEAELAEDINETMARDERETKAAEEIKSLRAANARATSSQSTSNASMSANLIGYANGWFASARTTAQALLSGAVAPTPNTTVAHTLPTHARTPPGRHTKPSDIEAWNTCPPRKPRPGAADKHMDSYSDEDEWEVVEDKSKIQTDSRIAQIALLEASIQRAHAEFNAMKLEPVMVIDQMHELNLKIRDLEKKRDKLQKELKELQRTQTWLQRGSLSTACVPQHPPQMHLSTQS